jgi:hypothetical protein
MDLAIHLVELLNKIIYDSSYDDFYRDRDRKLRDEFLDSLVKRLLYPSSRKPTLEDIQQALRLICLPAVFHEKNSPHSNFFSHSNGWPKPNYHLSE